MESEGFNLYKINKGGNTFYFKKGEKRRIKYAVDYQNSVNEDYYEIHRQAGWKLFFTSPFNFTKWTLWAKKYNEEENPVLYSVKEDKIKYAKKMALAMSLLYIPMVCLLFSTIYSLCTFIYGIQIASNFYVDKSFDDVNINYRIWKLCNKIDIVLF